MAGSTIRDVLGAGQSAVDAAEVPFGKPGERTEVNTTDPLMWTDVNELVPWLPRTDPYFVAGDREAEIIEAMTRSGFEVSVLDGEKITSVRELLVGIGEALRFPEYYGANWDALGDCLVGRRQPQAR